MNETQFQRKQSFGISDILQCYAHWDTGVSKCTVRAYWNYAYPKRISQLILRGYELQRIL